jgi:hypothetical protein
MKLKILAIVFCSIILLPGISFGQQFYRIKADFSIKEKGSDGASGLTKGTVYFDKSIKKVIYHITFPKPQIMVLEDTAVHRIENGVLVSSEKAGSLVDFSIFNLALEGELSNYGLRNSLFKVKDVSKDGDMVITTWEPLDRLKKHMGNIAMANKNRKLHGLVFYSPDGAIASKQFFQKYEFIKGLEFPTEITQVINKETGEVYMITSFKNITVDEKGADNKYNINIPL